ncbi:MAG: 30S ribosomal protein S4 [Anaerolineales bacterium]|nr:30S ribosomal protein S4 [Anaerolineales bacterium]
MAKYTGPVCRLCRREGEKLYLKGARCLSVKCPFEKQDNRRDFAPGQHGRDAQFKRNRSSDFLQQLREKQKARRVYGVLESQFRRYYEEALKSRGVTGVALLQILERRLDNVVYRLGYASSRAQARQLVAHGHINVNGRRLKAPSAVLKIGDVVEVRVVASGRTYFRELKAMDEGRAAPGWLNRNWSTLSGQVAKMPLREDIDANLNEQLIVEYYSR